MIDGKSEILIHNGYIYQDRMRKNRYNLDDLLSQLRSNQVADIEDVAFAILENNGQLSVLSKHNCNLLHPDPLIADGEIDNEVLKQLNMNKQQLLNQLKNYDIHHEKEVFLCLIKTDGLFVLRKEDE